MSHKDIGRLSVIMPALNEEKNIRGAIYDCLEAFESFNIDGEIIVINDGSTDSTEQIARQELAAYPGKINIIRHDRPKGIGASFWDGVDNAGGEIVVMLPGDNENDPQEILMYYRLLEHIDIVIPFLFNKEARSLFRNALSYVYRFIINTTFLVNFNYTNGTILYRKSILKDVQMRSGGFFFQTDILIRLVKKGYLFAEVPYKLGKRKDGASKAVTFPSFLAVVKGYLILLRDLYFNKHKRVSRRTFTADSQTAARRKA